MDTEILGIGLYAPGLAGWELAVPVLQGLSGYAAEQALRTPALDWLPANERRRCTDTVRLAIQAAKEAVDHAALDPAHLCSVFASCGDTPIADSICTCLAQDPRGVSPTQFHNSVHNAPAGYWTIATGSRLPSVSLSAYDGSFAAGLLDAVCLARATQTPTLLACYAVVPPEPLHPCFPLHAPFGVALVLAPAPTQHPRGRLKLSLSPDGESTSMKHRELEILRRGNPAARALPLLQALAKNEADTITLEYLDDTWLTLEYTP